MKIMKPGRPRVRASINSPLERPESVPQRESQQASTSDHAEQAAADPDEPLHQNTSVKTLSVCVDSVTRVNFTKPRTSS